MAGIELRISDIDRDRAAAVLHAAVGDGRLTWAEHEERLAGVYRARTGSELAPWLADLSTTEFATTPAFSPGVSEAPALQVAFSKVVRKPDPSVPPLPGKDWCWRLACTDGPVFRGADLLW